jgi:hypothetical protein
MITIIVIITTVLSAPQGAYFVLVNNGSGPVTVQSFRGSYESKALAKLLRLLLIIIICSTVGGCLCCCGIIGLIVYCCCSCCKSKKPVQPASSNGQSNGQRNGQVEMRAHSPAHSPTPTYYGERQAGLRDSLVTTEDAPLDDPTRSGIQRP